MKLLKLIYLILFFILFSCNEENTPVKMKNYLIDLNKKTYYKIIDKADELIIVGYFRDQDKLNNDFKNILNETAETLKDSITFAHIDVDKNYKFAKEKDIKCVPTYKFIKNGKVIRSFNGTLDSLQLDLVISDINSPQIKEDPENFYSNN
jgi:thioredoxin-like negative regulator of GroEL